MKRVFLGLAAMLAMAGASAQIYKSVGPDGKVVYSDRPSDTRAAGVSVIRAPVFLPVSKPAAISAKPVGIALSATDTMPEGELCPELKEAMAKVAKPPSRGLAR